MVEITRAVMNNEEDLSHYVYSTSNNCQSAIRYFQSDLHHQLVEYEPFYNYEKQITVQIFCGKYILQHLLILWGNVD